MGERKDDAEKAERRQKAFKEGKRYYSIVCPLCLKSNVKREIKNEYLFKTDDNPEIIQTRYLLGGRGTGGFFKNEKESIRLDVLRQSRPNLWENLKIEIGKLNEKFSSE